MAFLAALGIVTVSTGEAPVSGKSAVLRAKVTPALEVTQCRSLMMLI